MNKITEYHNKIKDQQQEIKELQAALSNNGQQIQELNQRLKDTTNRLKLIQNSLSHTTKNLALGQITSAEVIDLKEQAKPLNSQIETINETVRELQEAKRLIQEKIQSLRKAEIQYQVLASQLISEQLFKTMVENEGFKTLVLVWLAHQDPRRFSNKLDQQHLRSQFGYELFNQATAAHSNILGIHEARREVFPMLDDLVAEFS